MPVFVQQGKTIEATVVEGLTTLANGDQQIVVAVPQSVIAGIADVTLVRIER